MSSPQDLKARTWNYDERQKQSLLHFSPATIAEMDLEYQIIVQDLAAAFRPEGWAEENCIELMAHATWCERRAMSAETAAMNLEFRAELTEKQEMERLSQPHPYPDGYTAAEQSANAIGRMLEWNRFLEYITSYKLSQARLFDMALKRLERIRKVRIKVEPEFEDLPLMRVPRREPPAYTHPIQNEPNAA